MKLAHTGRYAMKILIVKKASGLLQYHNVKSEHQYVESGRVRVTLEDEGGRLEEFDLGPGACYEIRPGRRHRIEALEDLRIFEVSTPELDDVVRLSDDYGREGTSEA
ncbi:cupin domain-containing protein [bacterium]|nr:cupin domain-containing protein [bacterium]